MSAQKCYRLPMSKILKDAEASHWTYLLPVKCRPFAQLARYDRPIGYWLLALPGWIGLAFAALIPGPALSDLKWAVLIFLGAVAMRGAGCTYNDIIDRNLDAKVARTALRPIPAGTVSLKQAWFWLFAQCLIGFLILLTMPRPAQIIALCSLPLVAAYPFMKRITWWPQIWLGLTFNWAVLVAYAIKTGHLDVPIFILYTGLIFWTLGYDTIYACQDMEDDALIGVKSSARRMGDHIRRGVCASYIFCAVLIAAACLISPLYKEPAVASGEAALHDVYYIVISWPYFLLLIAPALIICAHFFWQVQKFDPTDGNKSLTLFKSNKVAGLVLFASLLLTALLSHKFLYV